MATANFGDFFRHLTRGMADQMLAEFSDQQLVERALGGRDEAAFQAMLVRHGPMVYRVCWRILQHSQDVEDAFQATFLVLAQKLRSLRKHASLASWLHGVAHRLALKTKARAATWRRHDQQASRPESLPRDDVTWAELRSALDFELSQIPDKWRLPLILCYLEGRTQDDAASQLGWSPKTLNRRLDEARAALCDRLNRRGITLPAALSAVLLSDCLTLASPAPELAAATFDAAWKVVSGQTLTICGVSAAVASLLEGGLIVSVKKTLLALVLIISAGTAAIGFGFWAEIGQDQKSKPFKVTIVEDTPEIPESVVAEDPIIEYQYGAPRPGLGTYGMCFGVSAAGKQLAQCMGTAFMIDGKVKVPRRVPCGFPDGSDEMRVEEPSDLIPLGVQSICELGDIRVSLILKVVPGKPWLTPPGMPMQLRMDTLLVKYIIENVGTVPHSVGCRPAFAGTIANNRAALFAAPTTHPKVILDGRVLTGKQLPEFLEVLEFPNLRLPGLKTFFTLKLGRNREGPSSVVLTKRQCIERYGRWDVPAEPLAGNDSGWESACAFFWEPKEILPHRKREIAFAYGLGIACINEGRVSAEFGGSFEPGKIFTIMAYVHDPVDGQSLTLQLPKGIERIEGKGTQIVPLLDEPGPSVVRWRCRLLEAGTHAIGIRSSTGVTKTWKMTVVPG